MGYFDRVKERFEEVSKQVEEWRAARLNDPCPCTEEEVRAFEEQLGRPLPASYREFLLWMGHGFEKGYFVVGEVFFFGPDMWRWATEAQEDVETFKHESISLSARMPEDAFVFWYTRGWEPDAKYIFFRLSEGEDPPVYSYDCYGRGYQAVYQSFSEFLAHEVERLAQWLDLRGSSPRRSSRYQVNQGYLDQVKARFYEVNGRIKKKVRERGIKPELFVPRPSEPCPCTEEEVQGLEEQLGQPLPAAYKEFLLWMGHGVGKGDFMVGEVFFIKPNIDEWLADMQEYVEDSFQEGRFTGRLPEDAFVFLYHDANFMFFRLSEGDDPPVYFYQAGYTGFKTMYESFSEFLAYRVESLARRLG